jgi:hypothetical protein
MSAQEQLCRPLDGGEARTAGVLASVPASVRRLPPCGASNAYVATNVPAKASSLAGSGPVPDLAPGQLWKVGSGYIQIVELGKRLIYYKTLRQPEQKAVMTRMMGIGTLAAHLKEKGAELVTDAKAAGSGSKHIERPRLARGRSEPQTTTTV